VTDRGRTRVVRRSPGFAGVAGAILFFCASLTPSLLPRSWILQGVIGGISAAIGYGVAAAVGSLALRLFRLRPAEAARRAAWILLVVAGSLLSLVTLVHSTGWQRELRRQLGIVEATGWLVPLIPLVSLATFLGLLLASRSIRLATRTLIGVLARFVPRSLAYVASVLIAVFLVALVLNDFLFRGFVSVIDVTSSETNVGTDRGVTRPVSPYVSGSPRSLVPWRTLGRQGRRFVSGALPREELSRFAVPGRPATDPIRVYTGLGSARSFPEQARLALRELERAGAFDRRVLAIMGPTGTGWVDGRVANALEMMYAGDSAMVAMQYSYLPSWASFMVDRSKAVQAARALIDTVHARWASMPAGLRPRLVVFGESLGAFGIEGAYGDLRRMTAGADGVLLVGPPGFNPIWNRLTARRDPGSPLWRPVYRGGTTVRFAQTPGDLTVPAGPWHRPRVVYLQNASDPVVWWSPELIYRRPGWLDAPRGPGVPRQMRWFPLVTFWQVMVDLTFSRGAPPGHGHQYGNNVVDGLAAIAAPPGWSGADTARLRTITAVRTTR
jgi:uncharacterized membrane protein